MARHRCRERRAGSPGCCCSNIAARQHKPTYTPNADTGDFVVIINADKVAISGNKLAGKNVYHHSGHPGGLQVPHVGEVLARTPERVVQKAVLGMIPQNKLGNAIGGKLKVYAGPLHPHAAQQPVPFEIKQVVAVTDETQP